MTEVGLQDVETYVYRHHNTVTQFIATRPIMDLCMVAERRLGPMVSERWMEQGEVDADGGLGGVTDKGGRVDGREGDKDRLIRW